MKSRILRIHGDNIIECERTLRLFEQAFDTYAQLTSLSLYAPKYEIIVEGNETLEIELLPGYERWGVSIADELSKSGGILREGADSYITEVVAGMEKILFAIEYCSALPAGNNAWQRNGRAYSTILAGVPYLYFAEIGGVELNEDREVKAPRFPNPIVPFSYIAATKRMKAFCIPVYKAHPSITEKLYENYKDCFGLLESLQIIRGIITECDYSEAIEILIQKALTMVTLLANGRRCIDTLRNGEWTDFFHSAHPGEWLSNNATTLIWRKKTADKVPVTSTFINLFTRITSLGCLTIGAKGIPVSIIPTSKREKFEWLLSQLYPEMSFVFDREKQLAIVWVTGFKPRGEDSRPDRGLIPMVRMILGNQTDVLAIVYGPAKDSVWDDLRNSFSRLIRENGLWEAIYTICDYVLIDSTTCKEKLFFKTYAERIENPGQVVFPYKQSAVTFSEQDIDSSIHQIFAHKTSMGIFECLCNPPGGDWSGISYFEEDGKEVRWTSLPRVSLVGGKRPDHVIQIMNGYKNIFLSIESKRVAKDLEDRIGVNLRTYITDLFRSLPTAQRTSQTDWRLYNKNVLQIKGFSILSVGAFLYRNEAELCGIIGNKQLDIVLAFKFSNNSTLHIQVNPNVESAEGEIVVNILRQISLQMGGFEVQVHGFQNDLFGTPH